MYVDAQEYSNKERKLSDKLDSTCMYCLKCLILYWVLRTVHAFIMQLVL